MEKEREERGESSTENAAGDGHIRRWTVATAGTIAKRGFRTAAMAAAEARGEAPPGANAAPNTPPLSAALPAMAETAVYVLEKEPPLHPDTLAWLHARPFALVHPIHRAPSWPAAMDQAVEHFLAHTTLPRLLILHGNAQPDPEVDRLWTLKADIAYARHAHHAPPLCRDSIQCGCLLLQRSVLQDVSQLSFPRRNRRRGEATGCVVECLRDARPSRRAK